MGTVEDKLEILDLVSRYCHAADGSDPLDFADAFTEDAAFNFVSSGRMLRGREELLAFAKNMVAGRGERQLRHRACATYFEELTSERARAHTCLFITRSEPGKGSVIYQTGVYHDEIIRTPQGWRFKTRQLVTDA